jgi:hypothetical protein
MANVSKQDRCLARTPADIERKYGLGQSFSEVAGYATEARRAAEQAQQAAESLTDVFAKDIVLSGTFTNTVESYLLPGEEEIERMKMHYIGTLSIDTERIPLYDFDNDGDVSLTDIQLAEDYRLGRKVFSEWAGAVKSVVTMTIDLSDPSKAIRFSGVNMWGREVESYLGIDFTTAANLDTSFDISGLEARIDDLEERIAELEGG